MSKFVCNRFLVVVPWVLVVILVTDIDLSKERLSLSSYRYLQAWMGRANGSGEAARPMIYVVTPTYTRPVQKAELTRLMNTFRQVPRFHWLLVEDSSQKTALVRGFLARCGLLHTHLNVATARRFKRTGLPRATEQRNEGLRWLRTQREHLEPGVVYFADDDNTYSLELFEEVRSVRKVGVWPVGLAGGRRYERPVVEDGRVVTWYTGWRADRPFATDMAGFAVNLQVILDSPRAMFKRRGSQPGMQESDFLKQITTLAELEPKASNCTKVFVWHTRTEKAILINDSIEHEESIYIEA